MDVLKNLKNFSFKIKDLEERIVELTAAVTATQPPPSKLLTVVATATQLPLLKPSSAVMKNLEDLTKKIAEYIEEIMPPQFLQSMLIIPKNQLHKYKLHKIVLLKYNEYIQETCQVVHDISNKLSTHISYSIQKISRGRIKIHFLLLKIN